MLTFVEAISLAGDRSKQNDDASGFAGPRAWVLDGATDLHDAPLSGAKSDASWIAHFANTYLHNAKGDLIDVTRSASVAAVDIWRYCELSRVRRRSRLSASTPPTSVKSMIGSCWRKESRPRKKAARDSVASCVTIQFWAVIWTQVPTLEVQAPNHCTRKSRYVKAANIRCIAFDPKIVVADALSGAGAASA